MKIALQLSLIILSLTISVSAQQRVPSELIGSYLFRFQWGGTRITLNSDGTFLKQTSNCTSIYGQSGPYSVSNDRLSLTTLKITVRGFGDDAKEIDLRKRKARKEILETDEPFKPEQSEIRIVRWGPRIYLMSDSYRASFIEAINLGFEPREVDGYRPLYGEILLREGHENKDAVGLPSLPDVFLANLLSAPITATVVSLETANNKTIATINQGSLSGLKVGTILVPESNEDPFDVPRYEVLSVSEQSSKVAVFGRIKVAEQLTTRVKDVKFYAQLRGFPDESSTDYADYADSEKTVSRSSRQEQEWVRSSTQEQVSSFLLLPAAPALVSGC